MNKETRIKVYNKYDGHCGYCGEEIAIKQMQVDHMVPIWRDVPDDSIKYMNVKRGENTLENMMPSCRECNNFKHTWDIEQFREELGKQLSRAIKMSSQLRRAFKYGLVKEVVKPIVFYFETINHEPTESK